MSSPLSLIDFLKTTDYLLEAEQQWEGLGITSFKLTSFSQYSCPVVDQETLERATPAQVQGAFKHLLPVPSAKRATTQASVYAISMCVSSYMFLLALSNAFSVWPCFRSYWDALYMAAWMRRDLFPRRCLVAIPEERQRHICGPRCNLPRPRRINRLRPQHSPWSPRCPRYPPQPLLKILLSRSLPRRRRSPPRPWYPRRLLPRRLIRQAPSPRAVLRPSVNVAVER